jgi:hypothetical protein
MIGTSCGKLARLAGGSDELVARTESVGTVLGSMLIGGVSGAGLADIAIGLGAAAGTSGAAATTSGLATLGFGSVATGGGGMVTGVAVSGGITCCGGVAGVGSLATDKFGELKGDPVCPPLDQNR